MPRVPSPEVVRFLLTHWAASNALLSDVREAIEKSPEMLDGYGKTQHDPSDIKAGLEAMLAKFPLTKLDRECA